MNEKILNNVNKINYDLIIDMLIVDNSELENVIFECGLEDFIEEDELIDELEGKDVFKCCECGFFSFGDDFVSGLNIKVCSDCDNSVFNDYNEFYD